MVVIKDITESGVDNKTVIKTDIETSYAKEYRNSKKLTNNIISIIEKISDEKTTNEEFERLLKDFKISLVKNDYIYNMGAYGSTKGITALIQLIANLIAKLLGRSPKEHNHFNKKINESLKTIIDEFKLEVKKNVEFTIPGNLNNNDKKKVLDRLIDLYEASVQIAEHQGAKIDVNQVHKIVVAYIEANSKNVEEMLKANLKAAIQDRDNFKQQNEENINNFESNNVKNDFENLKEIFHKFFNDNNDYKYSELEAELIDKVINSEEYDINVKELNETANDFEGIKYILDRVNKKYIPIYNEYREGNKTLMGKDKEVTDLRIEIDKLETKIQDPLSGISAIVNKEPNELLENTPVKNLVDIIILKSRMENYKYNNNESIFTAKLTPKSLELAASKVIEIFDIIAYADQNNITRSDIKGNKKFAEEFLESIVKCALDHHPHKMKKGTTPVSVLVVISKEVINKINESGHGTIDKEAMSQVLNILTNQLSNHGCKYLGKDDKGEIKVQVPIGSKNFEGEPLEESAKELFENINKIKTKLGIEASKGK